MIAWIKHLLGTILKTTIIIFKSPLWIDHLLSHVVQVIPTRKYRTQHYFRDWLEIVIMYCVFQNNSKYLAAMNESFLSLVCNYFKKGHKCLTSLQRQRDHCTEPTRYCPPPFCCPQTTFPASGTAHRLHTERRKRS